MGEIKIRVLIEAPGIVEALLAVAEGLGGYRQSDNEKNIENKEFKGIEQISESKKETTSEVPLEEVRSCLIKLSRNGKQNEVKEILNRLGFKKLTDVPKELYLEVLEEAKKINE